MGKCKNCKCGEMVHGLDNVKYNGKKYEMFVCTNCDATDYIEVKIKSNLKMKK